MWVCLAAVWFLWLDWKKRSLKGKCETEVEEDETELERETEVEKKTHHQHITLSHVLALSHLLPALSHVWM